MLSSRRLRILLVGEESAALQVLRAMAGANNQIVAIMTSLDASRDLSLAAAADRLGYLVWPASLVKDSAFAQEVNSAEIDMIINVHSRHIIHEHVLFAPAIGAFNMHPGPLPRYAGLNTVSWAIYRGDSNYGVTIHWMARRIDAGDIAYQSTFQIDESDTPVSLTHKCVSAGVPLIVKLLDAASRGRDAIPRVQQDLSAREYFGKKAPERGWLSWTQSAREIVNFVRACDYSPYQSPWGHPKSMWEGREIAIVRAARTHVRCDQVPGTVGRCDESGSFIATADEWVLVSHLAIDGNRIKPQAVMKPGKQLQQCEPAALKPEKGLAAAAAQ